jgi:hypothetical protein
MIHGEAKKSMSRIWKEKLNPRKHRDLMSTADIGGAVPKIPPDNLLTPWVYFVEVASMTFQFHSLEQLAEAHSYFFQKIHPTSNDHYGRRHEHYWQRWYERLPKGLNREASRKKIVVALKKALELFS